tara:strand:- start:820 stop:1497 length:678 start_codon:yes stop_codon:yes gene_type:complete
MKIVVILATVSAAVALPTRFPTMQPTVYKTQDATQLTEHGGSAHIGAVGGLGMCQGDCDSDEHCRAGLVCYHSSVSGNVAKGCKGKTKGMNDYCIIGTRTPTKFPTVFKTQDAARLTEHWGNAHIGAVGGLGMCQGDCDSDDHCRDDLVCHHSSKSGNVVPACFGKTNTYYDYCIPAYAKIDECDVTHCTEWTCAQWCKCYAATSESLYAASGCGDDGTLPCECP